MIAEGRPFVDTNVLVYLIGSDADKADRAEALHAARIVIGVQVLNEFADVALRKPRLGRPQLSQTLADIRRFAHVQPLTIGTHDLGLDLARRHQFSIGDAMIAAAALEAGCTTHASEDFSGGRRMLNRLTVRNPFV